MPTNICNMRTGDFNCLFLVTRLRARRGSNMSINALLPYYMRCVSYHHLDSLMILILYRLFSIVVIGT